MIFGKKPWSPQKIKEAVRKQDEEAYNDAFAKFYKIEFKKLLAQIVKNHKLTKVEAEDIIQDSMAITWQNCWDGKVKAIDKLGGYVNRTVSNKIKNRFSPQRRIVELHSLTGFEVEDSHAKEYEALLKEGYRLLEKIGEGCKKIILMWANKIPMKEIAEELSYSSADVAKKTKERCMKKLINARLESDLIEKP